VEDGSRNSKPRQLLDQLKQLLEQHAGGGLGPALADFLTAWQEDMALLGSELLTSLSAREREDLARCARMVQGLVRERLREYEKARRSLLVRALSYRAAREALHSYGRRAATGFFTRVI
jgi:hypothetical protein